MRFRMYRDYFWYIAMLKKKETFIILVDFGIFIATVYAFVEQITREFSRAGVSFSIGILLVLSTIKFGWDCYKMYSDYSAYNGLGKYMSEPVSQIVNEQGVFKLRDLLPGTEDEENGFQMQRVPIRDVHLEEYVLVSDEIDNYIRKTTEISLVQKTRKYEKVRERIKDEGDALLSYLTFNFYRSKSKNQYFFNEQKLCLSTDIRLNSTEVECHRGSYYDTYLTNIISMQKLVIAKKPESIVFDGRKLYPYGISDGELRLCSIKDSSVNNEIGVSTLAFTKDRYLVLWNQNAMAQSSGNLLVPSGSGSADWSDIVEDSFTQSIQKGMSRELKEESSLKDLSAGQIGETRIIGFFRWIRKAGKPEFVGITKMNAEWLDIKPEEKEVARISHTTNSIIKNLDQLSKSLAVIKSNPNISVPLYMNIDALERYISREPAEVIAFLGLDS